MRNKKSKILIFVGFITVIISLFYIQKVNKRMFSKRIEIEESKNKFIKEKNLEDIFDKNQDKNDNPELLQDEIGYIEIESLDLLLPIYDDTSYQSLKDGVGVVEGTDMPSINNNITSVIAGHRGGYNGEESFLHIDKLKNGDHIKVIEDKELVYEVIGQEVIESTDWNKFTKEEDKSKLILLTCHPYPINDKRLIIKTKLIDIKNI